MESEAILKEMLELIKERAERDREFQKLVLEELRKMARRLEAMKLRETVGQL